MSDFWVDEYVRMFSSSHSSLDSGAKDRALEGRKDKGRQSLVQNTRYKAHLASVLGKRLTPPPSPTGTLDNTPSLPLSTPSGPPETAPETAPKTTSVQPSPHSHTRPQSVHTPLPPASSPLPLAPSPLPPASSPLLSTEQLEEVLRRLLREEGRKEGAVIERLRVLIGLLEERAPPPSPPSTPSPPVTALLLDRSTQTQPSPNTGRTTAVGENESPSFMLGSDVLETLEIVCLTQPGIVVRPCWHYWKVAAIIPLSSVERDGRVERGDVIFEIGGRSVRGWSRGEVRSNLAWYHSGRVLSLTLAKCSGR